MECLSNLPKVTELVNGRNGITKEEVFFPVSQNSK